MVEKTYWQCVKIIVKMFWDDVKFIVTRDKEDERINKERNG